MICGKTIYPTSRDAIEAIKGLMKGGKSNKMPGRAYFCEDCNGYHLHTESKKSSKVTDWGNQRTNEQINSDSEGKKRNDRKFKDLIIHDPLKFKIK